MYELQRVSSCDSISSVIDYIIASCCSVNGHIEACLSSLGLAIELELHQYSLDHRALFVSLATTRLILSLFLSFFSSISSLQRNPNTPCCLKKAVHITHKACLNCIAAAKWKMYVGGRPDYRSDTFAMTVFLHFCQKSMACVLNVGPLLDVLKFTSFRIACIETW